MSQDQTLDPSLGATGCGRTQRGATVLAGLCAVASAFATSAAAEVIVRGVEGAPLHEARPAPSAVAPDHMLVVAQPSPSEINESFLGPVLLMKSAHVDLEAGTATLPLREGQLESGEKVWFVVTDVSDRDLAQLHGIPYAAKMAYGLTEEAYRTAHIEADGTWTFDGGAVDFSPEWSVTPGEAPSTFPPTAHQPGAIGDADYSPLVHISNAGKDPVFNAPVLAFDMSAEELNAFCDGDPDYSMVHDKVVSICPEDGTATIRMTLGYTFGKPIFYLSTDSNDELIATLEEAIYAPAMKGLPFANEDADPGEAAERIYAFANGPTGIENPHRQGVNSTLGGDGRGPLNVLGGIPTLNLDYSPMWRLFPAKWTEEAISKGYRTRMSDAIWIEDMAAKGYITSLDDGPLRAVGLIVNCPVVYRVN
ncbi:MAG: hypothetical protein AAF919_00720 [Pseudomonadota bacterium]